MTLYLLVVTEGTGYFRNVGNTQRMGTEVALNGKLGEKWSWYGNYSYVRASFETHQKLQVRVIEKYL